MNTFYLGEYLIYGTTVIPTCLAVLMMEPTIAFISTFLCLSSVFNISNFPNMF